MSKTYTLIIKFLGEVEFKCLLSKDLRYKRVLQDDSNYESMVDEIIEKGRIIVQDDPSTKGNGCYSDRYFEQIIEVNTPQELKDTLSDDFECELHEELKVQFTVYAEGADFGFRDGVMAESSKHDINALSRFIFNAANDCDYEPHQTGTYGSYGVVVEDALENEEGKRNIISYIKDIKSGVFNLDLYETSTPYKKFIDILEKLPTSARLESLKFVIDEVSICLNLTEINAIKQSKKATYAAVKLNLRTDSATAINMETRKFKIKDSNHLFVSCTAKSADLIGRIKSNEGKIINFIGYRLGPKSAFITDAIVVPL